MRKYFLLCFVLVFLMLSQIFAQTVTKYAGTAQTTNDPNPLSTSAVAKDVALFNNPYGIAIDGNSNIWVSDRLNHCIRMIKYTDQLVYVRAGYSQGYKNATGVNAQFDNPMGLAVSSNNDIYVADNGNNCIRKITAFATVSSAQTISNLAGNSTTAGYVDGTGSAAQFNSPSDVAIDASGNIFVADGANHAIRKVTPAGVVTTVAGGPTKMGTNDGTLATAQFRFPTGIFVTSTGDIYVADNNNQKIRKISGNNVTTVVSGLSLPDDVVVTTAGDIFISDQHKIMKYSGSTATVFAGSATNTPGYANGEGKAASFTNVKCMMYRSSDNSLYVADMGNHVIRAIALTSSAKPPVCSFTADKTSIAKNGVVNFTDQSTNTPTLRKWTFTSGTPSTSSVANPTITYTTAGSFAVKLVVSNADGSDSLTKTGYITVTNKNPPVCQFTADKTVIVKTKTVTFTDQSTNSPTSRKWTFTGGTPSTSTVASPVITYPTAGSYAVKLVVTNADGSDSLTKAGYITVNLTGINDDNYSAIKVYPSPATDVIYLNSGNLDFGNATFMITSIDGKYSEVLENLVKQNEVISIPVNNLQSGMYLLVVRTAQDLYRFRFVKQ